MGSFVGDHVFSAMVHGSIYKSKVSMLKINMALSETKVLYLNILLFSIFFNVKGTFIWYTPFSATHTHIQQLYIIIYIYVFVRVVYTVACLGHG